MGLLFTTNTSQLQWDLDNCPAGQTFNKLHDSYGWADRCLTAFKHVRDGGSDLSPIKMTSGINSCRQWVFRREDGCASQAGLGSSTYSSPVYGEPILVT